MAAIEDKDREFLHPVIGDPLSDIQDKQLGMYGGHPDEQLSFINKYLGTIVEESVDSQTGLPKRLRRLSGDDAEHIFGTKVESEILAGSRITEVFLNLKAALGTLTPDKLREPGKVISLVTGEHAQRQE